MPKMVEKKMAEVCDILGKKCSGPISFYLNMETKHMGIRINKSLKEASEPPLTHGMDDLLASEEYAEIDSQLVVLDNIPNRVIIQCPIEEGVNDPEKSKFNIKNLKTLLPVLEGDTPSPDDEETKAKEYPIQKDFHARHIIYTIKCPKAKELVAELRQAFVLAVLFEEGAKQTETAPAPEGEIPAVPPPPGPEMPPGPPMV